MTDAPDQAVYGTMPRDVAETPVGAVQVSPLSPGAAALESMANSSLAGLTALAPPGTLERRFVLAQALRTLRPGGHLTVAAPKTKGGARLAAELGAFGLEPAVESRRHHKICTVVRPPEVREVAETIDLCGPQLAERLGMRSQPGVFSWDRLDPGSALLAQHLPPLAGRGADLGCGIGVLALAILQSEAVTSLDLVDLDRRAVDAARDNVDDDRVRFHWRDLREPTTDLTGLDFVVTNPPFHDGGAEDKALGQVFIRRAAEMLGKGGTLWLVANRHLPYEAELARAFAKLTPRADAHGFKVFEARR